MASVSAPQISRFQSTTKRLKLHLDGKIQWTSRRVDSARWTSVDILETILGMSATAASGHDYKLGACDLLLQHVRWFSAIEACLRNAVCVLLHISSLVVMIVSIALRSQLVTNILICPAITLLSRCNGRLEAGEGKHAWLPHSTCGKKC